MDYYQVERRIRERFAEGLRRKGLPEDALDGVAPGLIGDTLRDAVRAEHGACRGVVAGVRAEFAADRAYWPDDAYYRGADGGAASALARLRDRPFTE